MSTSWLVLLLSCGIVLQLATALPQQRASQTTVSSPRENLLQDTLQVIANQSTDILRISSYVVINLNKELKALPKRSIKVNKFIKRFDRVLRHIDSIDLMQYREHMEEIFSALDEIGEIFDDIDILPGGNDKDVLEAALEKIGRRKVEERYYHAMEETLAQLTSLYDDFEKSLSEAEKQKEYQLIDWIHRFNAEDDLNQKLGTLIEEFLSFFD